MVSSVLIRGLSVRPIRTPTFPPEPRSTNRLFRQEPDGRFTMPAEFAEALEVEDGVMLVGKGDKFQLWNPKRWQARRDADRAKMEAFVRGLTGGDA